MQQQWHHHNDIIHTQFLMINSNLQLLIVLTVGYVCFSLNLCFIWTIFPGWSVLSILPGPRSSGHPSPWALVTRSRQDGHYPRHSETPIRAPPVVVHSILPVDANRCPCDEAGLGGVSTRQEHVRDGWSVHRRQQFDGETDRGPVCYHRSAVPAWPQHCEYIQLFYLQW